MIRSRVNTRGDDDFSNNEDNSLVLYKIRWLQLFILSILAMISDLVCFSVAAAPETWVAVFERQPMDLVDIFLFTNVVSCFLVTDITRLLGLKKVVSIASVVMALGCLIRSGVPGFAQIPGYEFQILGTILVGAAQPMFQCTPPLLSATWFGPKERAMATAVAINFNQVGIGLAFLIGGSMAQSVDGLKSYLSLISVIAVVAAIGTVGYFEEKPMTPPSFSAAAVSVSSKDIQTERSGWLSWFTFPATTRALLCKPGFLQPLSAFVVSIGITNVVSTFAEPSLHRAGIDKQIVVDLTGAGFQVAIVIGGIVLGGFVDRTKRYKAVTIMCLAVTLGLLILLGFAFGFQVELSPRMVISAIFALGFVAGPIQPVNAELAVEVSYPIDETSIASLQQLCGNLFSAMLVPLCELASRFDFNLLPGFREGYEDMRGDSIVLVLLAFCTVLYFTTFEAPLKRTEFDLRSDFV